MVGVQLGYEHQ